MPEINTGFLLAQLVNLALLCVLPALFIVPVAVFIRRHRQRAALSQFIAQLERGEIGEADFSRLQTLLAGSIGGKPERDDAEPSDRPADDLDSPDEDERRRPRN